MVAEIVFWAGVAAFVLAAQEIMSRHFVAGALTIVGALALVFWDISTEVNQHHAKED